MVIEYAQLLSSAHRLLDGTQSEIIQNGRRKQVWLLESEAPYYVASHVKHPDAIWIRTARPNYEWLAELFHHLCDEYEHRYQREHATRTKLGQLVNLLPRNIPDGKFTDAPLCMPDEYKVGDAVLSYQNLYVGSKSRFAKWTNRKPPEWFISRVLYDEAHFERTRPVAA